MARAIRGPSSNPSGILRVVERTGLRKGVEGNKHWFYIGTGLWTLRTIRRLAGDREEIVISERLKPGERIVIANGRATIDAPDGSPILLPRGRRAQKKLAKAAKKADEAAAERARKAAKKAKKAEKRSRRGRRGGSQ